MHGDVADGGFPRALYRAVNDDTRVFRGCLAWADAEGTCFRVVNLSLFTDKLAAHHAKLELRSGSYFFFLASLAHYGFSQIRPRDGGLDRVFAHKHFARQRPDDVWLVEFQHSMRAASPAVASPGTAFPAHALALVAAMLTARELVAVSSTCTALSHVDDAWTVLVRRDFPSFPPWQLAATSLARYQTAHRAMLNWGQGVCSRAFTSHCGVVVVSRTDERYSAVFSDDGFVDIFESQSHKLGRSEVRVQRAHGRSAPLDVKMTGRDAFFIGGVHGASLERANGQPPVPVGDRRTVSHVCHVAEDRLATAEQLSRAPVLVFDAARPETALVEDTGLVDSSVAPQHILALASSRGRVVAVTADGHVLARDPRCAHAELHCVADFSAFVDGVGRADVRGRHVRCADASDAHVAPCLALHGGSASVVAVFDWRRLRAPVSVMACAGSAACVLVNAHAVIVGGVGGPQGPLAAAHLRDDCLKPVALAAASHYAARKLDANASRLGVSCSDGTRLFSFAPSPTTAAAV